MCRELAIIVSLAYQDQLRELVAWRIAVRYGLGELALFI